MYDYVWLYMTIYDYYGYVRQFMTMFDCTWLCITICERERERDFKNFFMLLQTFANYWNSWDNINFFTWFKCYQTFHTFQQTLVFLSLIFFYFFLPLFKCRIYAQILCLFLNIWKNMWKWKIISLLLVPITKLINQFLFVNISALTKFILYIWTSVSRGKFLHVNLLLWCRETVVNAFVVFLTWLVQAQLKLELELCYPLFILTKLIRLY